MVGKDVQVRGSVMGILPKDRKDWWMEIEFTVTRVYWARQTVV